MTIAAKVVAAALLSVSASVQAFAAATDADSLNEAVAVFVASNIKLSVDNALSNLEKTGVSVDTAVVKRLILAELAKPYNEAAHDAANRVIDRALTARAVAESNDFIAAAAARQGAQQLPDGLVIETLVPGTGASPDAESTVVFRYTGSLPDGTVFDSIPESEEPLASPVSALTRGMTEAFPLLKAGGKYRLTIPAELAYGREGVTGVIPPDCALQFVIDFIDIK
ncbi:MAG: FKBP-type peptidyl-prolyl cis-trans isomerase [Muribaculaceae bacterium]|jgi:FKBP-type peptidyl-prolyl cis-trans isomerase|nr:FKBP-type peptidyl-prolyl cis-trans isomerase [Muribaculaceae bacterium]